jgi:hypothetical protein
LVTPRSMFVRTKMLESNIESANKSSDTIKADNPNNLKEHSNSLIDKNSQNLDNSLISINTNQIEKTLAFSLSRLQENEELNLTNTVKNDNIIKTELVESDIVESNPEATSTPHLIHKSTTNDQKDLNIHRNSRISVINGNLNEDSNFNSKVINYDQLNIMKNKKVF